ncbi:MAG: hypothetical protein HOH48_05710 [Candidatus Puniceispirillum sp.]|uniref:hypothetical protein n=1 Tax=Candidatus Puniceispirillum sp. TaxID=2026719 RepID=UPI001EB1F02B|nr:hypothetical protein [Candidatus Puniceispirillum sp.]MBT6415916.1 hypothetical protein [Candidatus Puniceispirillum sp.]
MRGTAALKSIEALYKEAETVIGDGVPMVAIVKSEPPMTADIPMATRPTAMRADTPQTDTPKTDRPLAPNADAPNADAQTPVFDRIEMLRSMAANLEDDKDPEDDKGLQDDKDSAAPESVLPTAPPVPAYDNGSRQISDAELEDVVKRAVDDIVATTPLDSIVAGNDQIESVMADIAEAVGKADPSETSTTTASPASPTTSDTADNAAILAKTPAQIDLLDLNNLVANTVKSVIREELSNLVQSTVKSTLQELQTTQELQATQEDKPASDR